MTHEERRYFKIGTLLCNSFTSKAWYRLVQAVENGIINGSLNDLHPDVLTRLDSIGWYIESHEIQYPSLGDR